MFLPSCDTMVMMGDVTECGSVIFAKNSDRQVNEPMSVRYMPASYHSSNSKLLTTYLEIEQVEYTNACILFAPTNIFGAEMGYNHHGLVIGNEALFTKIPSKPIGLTGMDLVRLVLERCATSEQGKNTIIALLNKYGQGGNCGFSTPFYYHNSFLIADSYEAWLIETVGKEYAAKRIRSGIQTISNEISFGKRDTFDECSENLITQAMNNGWCQSIDDFHFRHCYSGFSYYPRECYSGLITTRFACSSQRQQISQQQLSNSSKLITINDVFNILRHHQQQNESPAHGLTKMDLCMHAAWGPIRFTQTTGSLVSILFPTTEGRVPTHFATCSSLPCLSIYKPMWLTSSAVMPSILASSSSSLFNASLIYSSNNIWWKSELINRYLMKFYQKIIGRIRTQRDELEEYFIHEAQHLSSNDFDHQRRNEFSSRCFDRSDELTIQWFDHAQELSTKCSSEYSIADEFAWESWRKSARIPQGFLCYSKVDVVKNVTMCIGSSTIAVYSSWLAYVRHYRKSASLCLIIGIIAMIYPLVRWKIADQKTNTCRLNRFDFFDHQ